MIMILFVDEISLHFTWQQSNRLKSNNKQAIEAVHGPHSLVRFFVVVALLFYVHGKHLRS